MVPTNLVASATVTASSAVLSANNLKTIGRTEVWRSTGTTATLTVSFATDETIDTVALMTSNLSAASTWRIRIYNASAVLQYDSGTNLACPPREFGSLEWGYEPLGVNAFAFGMAAQSVLWIPTPYAGRSVVIDLVDSSNTSGYLEASRLVIGRRYEPQFNMSNGIILSFEERGKQARSEDGTLRSEQGVKMRNMSFSMDTFQEADRADIAEISRRLGTKTDFLISAFPSDISLDLDIHYTMMAKFTRVPGIGAPHYGFYSTQINVEET